MQARLEAKITGFGCIRRRLSAAAVGGHQLRRKAKSRNRTLIARGTGSFESISLQRRVRCELNLGEGGFADEIAAAPAGGFATLDTTICRIADPTLVARPRQLRDASTVMVRSFGRD